MFLSPGGLHAGCACRTGNAALAASGGGLSAGDFYGPQRDVVFCGPISLRSITSIAMLGSWIERCAAELIRCRHLDSVDDVLTIADAAHAPLAR